MERQTMARGTIDNPIISSEIVPANPKQTTSKLYRWGPEWEDDDRSGMWAVNTVYHFALRVHIRDDVALLDFQDFTDRLEDVRLRPETDAADARLVAYAKAEALSRKLSRGQRRRFAQERLRREVVAGRMGGPEDGDEPRELAVSRS